MFGDLAKSLYMRLWRVPRIDRAYKSLPTPETFRDIYLTKAWGDNGEPFYSGEGSSGLVFEQYCSSVVTFIQDHRVQSIVDLGCGDFAVGRRIVAATGVQYTGIDVVPELIEYHKNTVSDPRVNFVCADITRDCLPPADLYLVRQVLQHLSNTEIADVLANLGEGSQALISEDVAVDPKWFNVDKAHGPRVRSYGGVYIDRPPFAMPVVELWKIPLTANRSLRTVFLDQAGSK